MPDPAIQITGAPLSIADVERVARRGARVVLAPEAMANLARSRAALESAMLAGGALYGVNTGFGSLSQTRVPDDALRELQHNLLRSHAAGVGDPLPRDVARGMLLLLAASLCRGHSGVRPETAQAIVALLNTDVTPVVPSIGSVGASGDLAPLAHACLALIGEGEAFVGDERVRGSEALRAAGLTPLQLGAKEGLALINGTHLMGAQGALLLADVDRAVDAAIAATAMSIEACRATDAFLDARVYVARNQPGPGRVASRLRAALAGSQILESHRENDPRVQDPYSLRCAPLVLGAAIDAIEHARAAIERELGAVTDNPLVFDAGGGRGGVVSAGCFHGMPIAIPLDLLAIALSHVAGIAERRVFLILSAADKHNPLPPHLSPQPGLHSGLMIAQYTAAACVNEMIGLANPASVANIPTSAGIEDYNSFGPRAAAKARRSLDLAGSVIAIELLVAAEAMERHRPLRSGAGVERAHALVRGGVSRLTADRPPAPDIAAIEALIREGRFSDGG